MLHRKFVAALALGAVVAASPLVARAAEETRPAAANGGGEWYRDNGGASAGGRSAGDTREVPRRDDEVFARSSGGYTQDFPGIEVHDWVSANAAAAAARAVFHRAENDLSLSIRHAQHTFERSKDLQEALAAERAAYADYLLARQNALKGVLEDARYKQIMDMRDEMARRLSRGQASHDLTGDDVLAMATLKLNYASQARGIEAAALNGDAALKDARKKMMACSAKVAELRQNFDESLHDNTEIASARRHLEDARVALITAQAYLNASAVAGGAALDYAYYSRGPTQPRVYDGYGYGANSPYWVRY